MTVAAARPGQEAAVRELTYAQALNEALREEMARDTRVFVMGEDVAIWGGGGVFGVNTGLLAEFGPERVRATPISEEGITGMAVGAAVTGMRPVIEIMYVDFTAMAMDAIVNQAAKLRYMFGGRANAAQHSQSLEAWFCHIPGLKVVTPSTPYDAKGLLKTAIRDDNPVIFLEHKVLYFTKGPVPAGEYTIPFGVADVKREGTDCTVVGIHTMVHKALQAAEELAQEGISVEVIDPRTLVPLDVETLARSVRKTHRLVVTHEAYERCGVGAEIAMAVMREAFDFLDAAVERVCGKNVPVPYAEPLERAALP